MKEKNVLGLKLPSDPRWVDLASLSIEAILTDHAWCEQKAATTCISIIILNSENEKVVSALTPLVTEEWGHFRMVLKELEKRCLKLGRQRKDEYVNSLFKLHVKHGKREENLTERLLLSALIEARSCERFRLLSLHLEDESLKSFYHDLMIAEAGHYRLFLDLAKETTGEEYVEIRWKFWLKEEAKIMKDIAVRGDRIH